MPPGLGVTADGQFVLLRDVPQAPPDPTCPGPAGHAHLPPAGLGPGPAAAPRRFSRRARFGAVSGLALGALAVGALATPAGTPEPAPPALGGAVLNNPALNNPALNNPALNNPALNLPGRLTAPSSDAPAVPELATAADATVDPAHRGAGGPRRAATRPPEPHPRSLPPRALSPLGYPSRLPLSATRTSPLLRQADW